MNLVLHHHPARLADWFMHADIVGEGRHDRFYFGYLLHIKQNFHLQNVIRDLAADAHSNNGDALAYG